MTKNHQLFTLLSISFLALSLPLATNLVKRSSDDRSSATETDKSKINLKIAFKGLKPESVCSSSLTNVDLDIVNVTSKTYQSDIGTSITPITGEVNSNGDQVFLISNLALDNNFKSVDSFNYFQIKNPAYLSSRMCFDRQSSKMNPSAACDITLTNDATYDFSNYSLLPGDLNQDGIVNSSDFSIVKQNVDPSSSTDCNQEGDLNYDGMVNSFDTSYLKQSLLQTNDEVIIDLTTITPTPTLEPTPTMSPQKRSLTAHQIEIGEGWGGLIYHTKGPKFTYWLYTPNGYTKDKKWPLVVYLYGSNSMDISKRVSGLAGIIQSGVDYDAVVLIPQFVVVPKDMQLRFVKEKIIPKIVDEYNINTDKISLSGHSLAAGHTIDMALIYPGFFSAITPLSLCKHDKAWTPILVKEKIWIYHGNADTVCSKTPGQWTVSRITAAGGIAKSTIIKADHSVTDDIAIRNYHTIEWMIRQTRGQPWQD